MAAPQVRTVLRQCGAGSGGVRRRPGADRLRRAQPRPVLGDPGGGGNFGIVTSFTFRLHPVGPVVAFVAPFYPLEDIAEVMRGWRDAERSAPFMVEIAGNWSDLADDAQTISWVRAAWESIGAHGTGGVYLNFTGLADEPMRAGVDDALGRNLRRLAEIKAIYDPQNFFRYNNNILPADG